MKKSIQLCITIAIVIISIISCRKDNSSSQQNNPNTGNDTLLSKFIELDTTQAAPYDTIVITSYKYDNLNRIITIADLYYDNGFPSITNSDVSNYYYNGADTIAYKMIKISEDDGGGPGSTVYSDTTYFLSSSKDSSTTTATTNGVSTTEAGFTYTIEDIGNGTFIQTINSPGIPSHPDTVSQTTANGFVISQVDNTFTATSYPAQYPTHNLVFSFDNHPNPFYKIYHGILKEPVIYDYNQAEVGSSAQKNNYTQISSEPNYPLLSEESKFQYSYKANGYPATIVEYDWTSGPPIFSFKGIYIYQ